MTNARNNPNECCPCGYTYDSTQRMCVLSNTANCTATCPANSTLSGSTCTCNPGYVNNAYGGCQPSPETYTIALPGLEDTVTVMPGQTLSTYAQVTKSDGSAKSGAKVYLFLAVDPEREDQLPATYTGTLSANTVSIGGTVYSGETGTDGRLNFVFTAPQAGGTHTIYAACSSPTTCTNYAEGKIKVPDCPVPELTNLEDLIRLLDKTQEEANLTRALENGMNGYNLLLPGTRTAEQCLANRIRVVVGPPSISGYLLTSTIRTPAYQKHLWEVWNKFRELQKRVGNDPAIQQRCQTLITQVEGEMGFRLTQNPTQRGVDCNPALGRHHCIRQGPAKADPKHVAKTAFDIPPTTVRKFELALWLNQMIDSTVQQEANTCGLTWGGTFSSPDPVHFQLK